MKGWLVYFCSCFFPSDDDGDDDGVEGQAPRSPREAFVGIEGIVGAPPEIRVDPPEDPEEGDLFFTAIIAIPGFIHTPTHGNRAPPTSPVGSFLNALEGSGSVSHAYTSFGSQSRRDDDLMVGRASPPMTLAAFRAPTQQPEDGENLNQGWGDVWANTMDDDLMWERAAPPMTLAAPTQQPEDGEGGSMDGSVILPGSDDVSDHFSTWRRGTDS